MSWNIERSKKRVEENDYSDFDITVADLIRTMDFSNLGTRDVRRVQGAHIYIDVPNFHLAVDDAGGASIGTMAFRLRWRENGKRMPPIYLSRVSKEVFEIIKQGNYEAFKQQLVASHFASAVRAGNTA